MSIFDQQPGTKDKKKLILLITPIIAVISALLVSHYVLHVQFFHSDGKDPNFGKFAYSTANGQYLGKIEGWKVSTNEWIIHEPTGSNIPMSKFRVEVSDTPPGPADDRGKAYKSTSGKPPNQ